MKFDLPRPCNNCPFRSDKPFPLHPQRALDIMSGDHTFACHKTVDYDQPTDEEGRCDGVETENSQHCAGFLILREKMSKPTQMMRIAERLGLYDPTKLDMNSPVFEDIDAAMVSFKILDKLPARRRK